MLRILTKRGLNLEEYFRSMDADRKGLIHKKQLLFLLKQLGLPFSPKEMQEITQNYCEPGSDKVDYISFLREGRISKKNNPTQSSSIGEDITESKNASSSGKNHDLSSYTAVLHEVKRLLLEAIKALNKNFDDVYRMFTRWDTQGTGTVTATQFLRVLARLHIELSDQDQDFLVELLDTNAMGRIDFESLLSFCFNFEDIASPQGIIVGTAIGFDDNAGETLSAVSIDQNSLEQKSTTSGNLLKRPHTASISRPYNNNLNQPSISNMSASKQMDNAMIPMNGLGNNASNFSYQKSTGNDNAANAFEERKKNDKVRPSTAVGRVSSSNNRNQFQPPPRKQPEEIEEEDGVLDLPDDVIHGEEIYLSNNNNSNNNYRSNAPQVKYNQFFQEGGNDDYPPEPSPCKFSIFLLSMN
jgi:Ca2+-binding EF-hand superfamily protein